MPAELRREIGPVPNGKPAYIAAIMNSMALLAMAGIVELLLLMMFLGVGLVVVGAVVFVAIRATSSSNQLRRRVEELERQIRDLRKPPQG
jgi:cell division protein FtsB